MLKVVVLGAGNVGTHLCIVFEKNPEILLLQNYNRKGETIQNCGVPIASNKNDIVEADIYIFTFSDDSLTIVNSQFSHLKGIKVHTSGSSPMNVFSGFERRGVFYALQSFTKEITVDFSKIPIAIEASDKNDEQLLLKLAKCISTEVYILNSQQRNALHVAAVFANNFSNFMLTQAADICKEHHIDFNILNPLIEETIHKLKSAEPNKSQTGPAVRKDSKTIDRHISTLKNRNQAEIYKLLTKKIQDYYE